MIRHDTPNGRFYEVFDGELFPSVTTVLSATRSEYGKLALERWRQELGPEKADQVLKDAGIRGTRLHKQAETFLKTGREPDDPDGYWNSLAWFVKRVERVELIEAPIWHPAGYAGTIDLAGVVRYAGLTYVDWKSALHMKSWLGIDDYIQQSAAYVVAIRRVYGLDIRKAMLPVATENMPAQVFKLTEYDIEWGWKRFKKRLRKFQKDRACPT